MYISLLGSVNYSNLCTPYGIRIRASAVKGQRVNHFTNGAFKTVGPAGFEPAKPKRQIYSLLVLTTHPRPQIIAVLERIELSPHHRQ